ncbi:MAG: glycosyltransferase family 4 protein [bacterium]|nr:glycosyltransferase family 4 protein [bacterium]
MKLCFLANIDDNHCRKWIGYFADRGYEIHLLSRPSEHIRELQRPNIAFYPLRISRVKFLDVVLNVVRVRKLVRKIKPDVAHALYAGVSGMLGSLSGFHPFVVTAFGSDILINSKSGLLRPFVRFMLNKADLVTCNGQTLFDEMLKLGVSPSKIRFIYWGTDVEKFKPGPKNKRMREELGIFDAPLVISIRDLEPVYDVETLVRAIPIVLGEIKEAKFLIAGRGSLKKKLEDLAQGLNVSDSIRFAGWLPEGELPRYLNSSDVYVSTSLSDGDLSQSTQQAMACEVPVVITALAVNEKRVSDGLSGLLFPLRNHALLALKIVTLLKDEKLRIILGKAGREVIATDLNYFKNMEEAENLYRELGGLKK